jgi:hypothetical protein
MTHIATYEEPRVIQYHTKTGKSYYVGGICNILLGEEAILFRTKDLELVSSVRYENLDTWYITAIHDAKSEEK